MRLLNKTAIAVAAGAAISYLFDPENGRRRRAVARDRLSATLRRTRREAERKGRYYAGKREGVKHALGRDGSDEFPNDVTLQHKIESEVLRDFRGQINVNVEEGIAVLRGTLNTPDEIKALTDRARKVDGVLDVRNLLHLVGTPAPTWESATKRR